MLKEILLLTFFILILDYIFIGLFMISKWKTTIFNIQGSELSVNYFSALFVYILIITGIMLFVYPKKETNFDDLFVYGFLWGFITYGIFDFTNLSIIKKYPLKLAIIDSIWGGILVGTSVLLTYLICK